VKPALTEVPQQSAVTQPPQTQSAPDVAKTKFVCLEPHATQVFLCGEFNAWSPEATPMTRRPDGHWETSLALQPGRYQYKYLADGQWLPDPKARECVPNEHGSLNSVVVV
jgi:1,4-alpha-glucan branching enzyme